MTKASTIRLGCDGPEEATVCVVASTFQVVGRLVRNQEMAWSIRVLSSGGKFADIEKLEYTGLYSLFQVICRTSKTDNSR